MNDTREMNTCSQMFAHTEFMSLVILKHFGLGLKLVLKTSLFGTFFNTV